MSNLAEVVFWGGPNEEKDKTLVKWDHDYVINAGTGKKIRSLGDISLLIPYIFDCPLDEVSVEELYDKVFEYKKGDISVEAVTGFEYSEYKIYGPDVDFEAITARLKAAGASNQKPEFNMDIPGRPPLRDMGKVNSMRYNYNEDVLEEDTSKANKSAILAGVKGVLGVIGFGFLFTYLGFEVLVAKYTDVTPPAEEFVIKRGPYVVYSVDGRMTMFKLAGADAPFDSTYKILVPEGTNIRRKNVVGRLTDAAGNIVYDVGNRIVDYDPDPISDYSFVNSTPFVFDAYGTGDNKDWQEYGELSSGNAEKIILEGTIREIEGKHLLALGRAFAYLGDATDPGNVFYEGLTDDISYAASIFSLRKVKKVRVLGQIEKTFNRAEGRNSINRIIFSFKVDFVRGR